MRVVRVLPDVPAIDRTFDYSVPDDLGDRVRVGAMVRVPLAGRRVAGWITELDSEPPAGTGLAEVAKVSGVGPDAATIDLCRWVAWRWAGRLATILRAASPDRMIAKPPAVRPRPARSDRPLKYGPGVHLLQEAPTTDPIRLAVAAATLGQTIVVTPSIRTADRLVAGLRGKGSSVARWPYDWAAAAGGATVVGGRGAVFAPCPALAAIVVFDEHDEGLQNESSPTWNAREIAVERARRAGVPCVLVSPAPSLEARALAQFVRPIRDAERAGWAPLAVIDRRSDDIGRSGMFSSTFVDVARETARSDRRVVCVLNRTGRARLLACRSCGAIAECENCGAAVHLDDTLALVCQRCDRRRPPICLECASTALAVVRPGVSRAAEELEALMREPVVAVTAATGSGSPEEDDGTRTGRVLLGTEAVLHRVDDAGLVAFVDVDQELLAPRYRAAEEALALMVLANRVVGGRSGGGRLLVQTRRPDHEVIQAALHAEPSRVADAEAARRELLRFPPAATIVMVGGEAAPEYIDRVGHPLGIDVQAAEDGRWLLRSDDRDRLLDHLATITRPPGRLRLQVDPARLR